MTGALAHDIRVETEPPDLELTLPARAENVAVARHAIGGLGDVIDVSDQTLAESLELGSGRNEETEVRMTFRLGTSDGAGGP